MIFFFENFKFAIVAYGVFKPFLNFLPNGPHKLRLGFLKF